MRLHAPVYALILLLLVETSAVSWFMGDSLAPFLREHADRVWRAVKLLPAAILLGVLFQRTGASPLRYLRATATLAWQTGSLPKYIYAFAVLTVFFPAFLYNKMLIPVVVPFQWDATFAEWDRLLFAGHHPWQLLHPLLATPAVTIFLDMAYALWVPIVFTFWCLIFAGPRIPDELRHRYLLATVATWIFVGLGLATVFSSAGPCYFAALNPDLPSPYTGLTDYLASVHNEHPLGAILTKQYLWAVYSGGLDLPGGISAMPSMHNAQVVLFAAAAYRVNRAFGHVMAAYAAIIFVGSIHLAWHYAIDGIVGAACAILIWWAAGLVVRRHRAWITAGAY